MPPRKKPAPKPAPRKPAAAKGKAKTASPVAAGKPALPRRGSPHPHAHATAGRRSASCAVVTVSDTRTAADDHGGALACRLLEAAGHQIAHREIIPDDLERIWARAAKLLNSGAFDLLLITGGTGVSARDITPEAVRPLIDKELVGFGELFRQLSFAEIGPAAFFSRAFAGVSGRALIVALPGSPAAVGLALEKLLLPELSHLAFELRKHDGVAHGARIHP